MILSNLKDFFLSSIFMPPVDAGGSSSCPRRPVFRVGLWPRLYRPVFCVGLCPRHYRLVFRVLLCFRRYRPTFDFRAYSSFGNEKIVEKLLKQLVIRLYGVNILQFVEQFQNEIGQAKDEYQTKFQRDRTFIQYEINGLINDERVKFDKLGRYLREHC